MSTTTSAPARQQVQTLRIGQLLLSVILLVCALVALSTAFSTDPFPAAAVVLIATFGVLAAVWGLVVVWSVRTVRGAGAALWALPVFFVVHVATLGTWLPDAVLAVVAAAGVLLVQLGTRAR